MGIGMFCYFNKEKGRNPRMSHSINHRKDFNDELSN